MKYFTITEFAYSQKAKALKIDNTIPDSIKPRIEEFVNKILDPLREAWGSGIRISSGYRGSKLNKAVKGSSTSAHCLGYGADLVPMNGKIEEFKIFVHDWLQANNIMFDQFINEYDGNASWVHIGYKNSKGQQRKQYMLYKNGKYTYTK